MRDYVTQLYQQYVVPARFVEDEFGLDIVCFPRNVAGQYVFRVTPHATAELVIPVVLHQLFHLHQTFADYTQRLQSYGDPDIPSLLNHILETRINAFVQTVTESRKHPVIEPLVELLRQRRASPSVVQRTEGDPWATGSPSRLSRYPGSG